MWGYFSDFYLILKDFHLRRWGSRWKWGWSLIKSLECHPLPPSHAGTPPLGLKRLWVGRSVVETGVDKWETEPRHGLFHLTFVALDEIDIFKPSPWELFFRFCRRHFQFFHPPTTSFALSLSLFLALSLFCCSLDGMFCSSYVYMAYIIACGPDLTVYGHLIVAESGGACKFLLNE